MKEQLKGILEFSIIVFLFLVVSFFVQTNLNSLVDFMKDYKILGAIIFVLFSILVVIVLPLTSIPIIPLVSHIYGWQLTGLLNFVGILLGCLIVFYICQKWGKELLKKFVSLNKIERIEKKIKEKNKFVSLVLLRMLVPAEILSYAVGLFTNISWKVYFWASFIGLLPFAFIIAYLGILPWIYQAILLLVIFILLIIQAKKD